MLIILAGLLAGVVSGFFKLGWEILLPPRNEARNETNPPQRMLQQVGLSKEFTHKYYEYSGEKVQYVSLIMHFGFSITFSLLYVWLITLFPVIGIWQGTIYGISIWVLFHLIIMPITHTVPSISKQPFEEHFSEFLGHVFWGYIINICYVYFYLMVK
ncbi:DUF1440 domain-containing protein [Periweissella fabalis]|uniref:DUF1440 domain-containing protein n=1 Tax=Periweissella fabalis TaxID=1070421 RepID=A0A7X6N0H0_9LACO|nr:DUF1440 domain-containing protein [Periweissella fabalis]MCM0599237.1 DUF1440 domain-containing protein [Periweissella fabalis]NKZ23516.1 DUF1440 domain-containing protein [Periweissella fabalis]